MSDFDYSSDLQINKDALDREWLRQSSLYMKYARAFAKADVDAKRASEKLKAVDADLSIRLRKEAENLGIKATDKSTEAAVLSHSEHKEAAAEYYQALEEAKMLDLACDALNHKKAALENLVKLHLAGYYASPTDVKESDTTEKALDAASNKQTAELNKKRKPKGE